MMHTPAAVAGQIYLGFIHAGLAEGQRVELPIAALCYFVFHSPKIESLDGAPQSNGSSDGGECGDDPAVWF